MEALLERVARKISGAEDDGENEWYDVNPEYWTRLAKAAVLALEPRDCFALLAALGRPASAVVD